MTEQSELIASTPGEILARERCRRNLSTRDVSRSLNLSRTIIEAIEADRINDLASIYRRGYVTNYARFLGLEPEPLLEALPPSEDRAPRPVLATRPPGFDFDRFAKIATYVLVTTVIVPPLVWFFVQGGSRLFEREVAAHDPPASETGERPGSRVGDRIAQALALDPPEADSSRHLSASALPLNTIRSPSESGGPPAESAPVVPPEPGVELAIELREDSWVEITAADGERLEFDLLRAGTRRSYRGEPPFDILLGRANAARLSVDGEAVRFAGQDQSDITRFQLDPETPES